MSQRRIQHDVDVCTVAIWRSRNSLLQLSRCFMTDCFDSFVSQQMALYVAHEDVAQVWTQAQFNTLTLASVMQSLSAYRLFHIWTNACDCWKPVNASLLKEHVDRDEGGIELFSGVLRLCNQKAWDKAGVSEELNLFRKSSFTEKYHVQCQSL